MVVSSEITSAGTSREPPILPAQENSGNPLISAPPDAEQSSSTKAEPVVAGTTLIDTIKPKIELAREDLESFRQYQKLAGEYGSSDNNVFKSFVETAKAAGMTLQWLDLGSKTLSKQAEPAPDSHWLIKQSKKTNSSAGLRTSGNRGKGKVQADKCKYNASDNESIFAKVEREEVKADNDNDHIDEDTDGNDNKGDNGNEGPARAPCGEEGEYCKAFDKAHVPKNIKKGRKVIQKWLHEQWNPESTYKIPSGLRRIMRLVSGFVPECATTCYKLSLHILMSGETNTRCLAHHFSHVKPKTNHMGDKNSKVIGTPFHGTKYSETLSDATAMNSQSRRSSFAAEGVLCVSKHEHLHKFGKIPTATLAGDRSPLNPLIPRKLTDVINSVQSKIGDEIEEQKDGPHLPILPKTSSVLVRRTIPETLSRTSDAIEQRV
ncbi:hypothetical protein GYMLUDRAFT_253093 [Collybiopsis luxurians FD-317 M1]|uniref:Uncharacterized protein n=1 Tax=Collybiopsis luxurians FD-317 M1 TaxID=944289 RepID=A0A0D0C6F4_9AGAR|nr:hypothetical protein GYMLUDRAFT_253093 [Collybiopsis luxurians FD-317 M1]